MPPTRRLLTTADLPPALRSPLLSLRVRPTTCTCRTDCPSSRLEARRLRA